MKTLSESELTSEIEKLREELRRTKSERDKYKNIFDVVSDSLLIVDVTTVSFIECNDSAVQMFGASSKSELLACGPLTLSPEFQPNGETSASMVENHLNSVISGESLVFQWLHKKIDGSTIPCLVSLALIKIEANDFVVAVIRDIGELLNTQSKLEYASKNANYYQEAYLLEKEKFEHFVNLAPVGIAINRLSDGSFEYVNNEFSRFTGYTVDELNDMDYWQLTPRKYQSQEQEQIQLMQNTGRYGPYKKEYLHKKGHSYPVLLSGIKITSSDNIDHIWSVVQDISAQQNIENQLRQAKLEAESSNLSKSQFLSNMSHEIRTPINSIMGTLQLLERDINISNADSLIRQAIYSSNMLLKIVNDILDYSKIEANQLAIEKVDVDLLDLIRSLVKNFSPEYANKNLDVNINYDENTARLWLGDPVRIEQIITNLLSNAIKFTESGSITVSVRESQKTNKKGINIIVSDTGIGMSEHALATLFDRFAQGDTSTTRRYGGTGLGMSITKSLIDLMQGTIKVVSQEGKGTRFSIYLPLQKTESTTPLPSVVEKPSTPDFSGKTILIAEDNSINRDIIDNILKQTNAKLYFAENGKEAVKIAHDIELDMILMDIQMPIMDGIKAFQNIRKFNPSVSIIAVTASVMSKDIETYKSLGFTSYVSKPFNIDDFYASLESYL